MAAVTRVELRAEAQVGHLQVLPVQESLVRELPERESLKARLPVRTDLVQPVMGPSVTRAATSIHCFRPAESNSVRASTSPSTPA
jgi:hypothetical protein